MTAVAESGPWHLTGSPVSSTSGIPWHSVKRAPHFLSAFHRRLARTRSVTRRKFQRGRGVDVLKCAVNPPQSPSNPPHSGDVGDNRSLKQVTVLFVDVVGSTMLSHALDPEDIQSMMDGALRQFTDIVQAHGGRVLQYAGDSLLAVFGAEVSVEDDPEQAVRAALQIVESAQRTSARVVEQFGLQGFDVRAGLDTGNVLLGGGVDGPNTVRGIAVNMAARMEQSAPAGRVRISQNTFRHVHQAFSLQEESPIAAKGFAKPLRSYLVDAASSRQISSSDRGIASAGNPLIGRDRELGLIKSAFYSMLEERRWSGLALAGEPGIGKSRMLQEFDAWLSRRTEPVCRVQGRCERRQSGVPYSLLRDMLVRQFAILDSDSLPAALMKLTRGLRAVFGERSEEHASIVGQLIGLDCGSSPWVVALGGDGSQLRSRAFAVLTQFLQGLQTGQNCPVVLLLEDLQWADQGSLDFLRQLPAQCLGLPVMMLSTTREKAQERSAFSASDSAIELSALSDSSGHDLVDAVLGCADRFPPGLHDLVFQKAQGNPYFIVEIVNMMVDEGVIVADGPHWKVQDQLLRNFRVPTTLTSLLQARLDLLPGAERLLLQKASVIGYVFWDEPLQRVARAVTETLDKLRWRDLVLKHDTSSVAGTREHVFKHHVLHQVTYDSVLKQDKRQLHLLSAEWLLQHSAGRESEFRALIAAHFEQAGDASNAVIHLRHAAIDAGKKFAHEACVAFVDRALRLTPVGDLATCYELIKVRAGSLDLLARRDEELADIHVIERLADELNDDAKRAEATAFRARYAVFTGDDSFGAALAEQAAVLARSCGETATELLAMSLWASALMHQHDYAGAETIAAQMLPRAAAAGEYRRHIDALHLLGNVATERRRYSAARAHFEQALHIAQANENLLFEAIQLHNVADVERQLGNFAIARERLEHGLRVCSRVGAQKIQVHLLSQLAQVEIADGAPEIAMELLSKAEAAVPALRNAGLEADLLSIRGKAQADLGRTTDALTSYRESQASYERAGLPREAIRPMSGVARLLHKLGQTEEALAQVEQVEDRMGLDDYQESDLLLACSEVRAAMGQSLRAASLLSRARDLLQRQAERLDPADRVRFLGAVPSNAAIMKASKISAPSDPE